MTQSITSSQMPPQAYCQSINVLSAHLKNIVWLNPWAGTFQSKNPLPPLLQLDISFQESTNRTNVSSATRKKVVWLNPYSPPFYPRCQPAFQEDVLLTSLIPTPPINQTGSQLIGAASSTQSFKTTDDPSSQPLDALSEQVDEIVQKIPLTPFYFWAPPPKNSFFPPNINENQLRIRFWTLPTQSTPTTTANSFPNLSNTYVALTTTQTPSSQEEDENTPFAFGDTFENFIQAFKDPQGVYYVGHKGCARFLKPLELQPWPDPVESLKSLLPLCEPSHFTRMTPTHIHHFATLLICLLREYVYHTTQGESMGEFYSFHVKTFIEFMIERAIHLWVITKLYFSPSQADLFQKEMEDQLIDYLRELNDRGVFPEKSLHTLDLQVEHILYRQRLAAKMNEDLRLNPDLKSDQQFMNFGRELCQEFGLNFEAWAKGSPFYLDPYPAHYFSYPPPKNDVNDSDSDDDGYPDA